VPVAGPINVVVVGDNLKNVVVANASTGQVLSTMTLSLGSMSAPALIWNSKAYFGESTSNATSLLHAYSLAASPVIDTWSPGISVAGSIDASPIIVNSILWVANNKGQLLGFQNPNSSQPTALSPFSVFGVGNSTVTVPYLLNPTDGRTAILVTQRGLFGVDVSTGNAALSWSAFGGVDLSTVAPVRTGSTLFVAAANTIYSVDLGFTKANPYSSLEMPAQVAVLVALGGEKLLVGCTNGQFVLLDTAVEQSLGSFNLSQTASAIAWTRLIGGDLFSFSSAGAVSLTAFTVGANAAITASTAWTSSATAGFAGGPAMMGSIAMGVTVDGKLYSYDVGNNTVLLNGVALLSGTRQTAIVACGEVVQNSAQASVTFLLDGENYFPALRNTLIAVLNKSFNTPASLPSDLSFEGLIKAIGNAGINAYVMMWNSSVAYFLTDGGTNWTKFQIATTLGSSYFSMLFNPNGAFRGDHRLNSQTVLALNSTPNVSTYLENYQSNQSSWFDLPVELGSNHQKIIIASVAGVKIALVSGFNTITPSYYDSTAHTMLDSSGNYDGQSWHDTGLILTGPAVDLIEAEFDRRWSKTNAKPSPSGTTYVKFANWMIARGSILGPATSPPPYTNPLPSTPAVSTQVMLTSNETFNFNAPLPNLAALLSNVRQILDQLIANIAAATSYIYFENFTFTSSEIVMALARKLQSSPPSGFQIIILVPHPTVDEFNNGFSMELGQLILTRLSYAALKLSSTDWDYYILNTGDQIQSTDTTEILFDVRGIERTLLTFTKGGSTRTVSISDVVAIHSNGNAPQVVMCSPARYFTSPQSDTGKALQGYKTNFRGIYIHSKLALFDDKIAVVGSANYSQRSMRVDGELSVFVNDAPTALAIRQQLFTHWGMSTPASWVSNMTSFVSTTTSSVGVLPLLYSAMPNSPASYTWSFLTTFVDPSQLL
jgi:phosphatidylserine/phosphatidylglycerophosphate/cardiolipin synthase-like enzyme